MAGRAGAGDRPDPGACPLAADCPRPDRRAGGGPGRAGRPDRLAGAHGGGLAHQYARGGPELPPPATAAAAAGVRGGEPRREGGGSRMSTVTNPRPAGHRRLYEVGTFVHERVTLLQEKFLLEIGVRKEPAQGVLRSRLAREINAGATLANLRRGIGKKVGELPALWQITLEGLLEPDERVGDDPTPEEQAAYTAITLYALHQQSRREGMHQRGRGLGTAVATLARRTGNEAAVRRRFEALGTAESFPEVVHHARGLVTQLRGENIGLDYGLF